jgi:hypothetical protein
MLGTVQPGRGVDHWQFAFGRLVFKVVGFGLLWFRQLDRVTQFRLRFAKDDNNNHVADYLIFYSGNATTASARPTLIIKYRIPWVSLI